MANRRTVYQRTDGQWANKNDSASKPASLHPTQKAANDAARQNLANSGGGELTTKGANRNGARIVSKDTIAPGNESSIRDTEH